MAFMASSKPIDVELEYVELGESDIIIVRTDKQREIFEGQVKIAKAKFDRPRWSNYNAYISGCVKEETASGRTELDITKLREQKLLHLLMALEDGDGNEVKLEANFYMNVHPDFAVGLVEAYDNKLNEERFEFLKGMGAIEGEFATPDEEEEAAREAKEEKKSEASEKETKVESDKE